MTTIKYGGDYYQVSKEFRGMLMRSVADDQKISASERTALNQVAKTDDEKAFLASHVRMSGNSRGFADFDPNQLSFTSGPPEPPPINPLTAQITAGLNQYTPENPIPLADIPKAQQAIDKLKASGQTEDATRLQGVLDQKINELGRYRLNFLDRMVSSAVAHSPISKEDRRNIVETSRDFGDFVKEYGKKFDKQTQELGKNFQIRLQALLKGDVVPPSAFESSDGPKPGKLTPGATIVDLPEKSKPGWNAAGGLSFRTESGPQGESRRVAIAAAATRRITDDESFTGYVGFESTSVRSNPEAAGVVGPVDKTRAGSRVVVGASYERGRSAFKAEYGTDGRARLEYERQLNGSNARLRFEVEADPERRDYRGVATIKSKY